MLPPRPSGTPPEEGNLPPFEHPEGGGEFLTTLNCGAGRAPGYGLPGRQMFTAALTLWSWIVPRSGQSIPAHSVAIVQRNLDLGFMLRNTKINDNDQAAIGPLLCRGATYKGAGHSTLSSSQEQAQQVLAQLQLVGFT